MRHALAVPFAGETLSSHWLLADVHMSGYPFPAGEMAIYWHQDGIFVLFPISPGRVRIVADLGADGPLGQDPTREPTLDEVQAIVSRRGPPGLVLSDPVWLSSFHINERKVADYRSGRVFLAGDAAHVHSPAGGQGMNTGMQDAFNLAWKLALVCRRQASASLLDSYSVERSAIGAEVLAAAGRLTAVAVLQNPAAQALRNAVVHLALGIGPVRRKLVETTTEVSIGYRDSPLNGPAARALAGPEPGERMPPANGQPPVGAGREPHFALLATPSDVATRLLHDWPTLLEPSLRPPPAEDGLWLVRPDGYVACTSTRAHAGALGDYLGARVAP